MKFYYRYIEQISSPFPDKGFQLGKNIHALASYYLKGADITKFETILSKKESEIWKSLKHNDYLMYDVVGIEKSISVKIKDFWIGGRIDAIVKKGKNYFILDYKTGGVEEDMVYDFQTMIYLLLCDSVFSDYSTLSFVYIDLKNSREIKIELSDSLKTEYTERILSVCNKIKTFRPLAFNKKTDCKCEYKNICSNPAAI